MTDLSRIQPQSDTQQSAESLDNQLDLNTIKKDIETDENSSKKPQKKETKSSQKPHRKSNSKAVSLMHNQSELKDLFKHTAGKSQAHQTDPIKQKIQAQFNDQLHTHLAEQMQHKAANLTQQTQQKTQKKKQVLQQVQKEDLQLTKNEDTQQQRKTLTQKKNTHAKKTQANTQARTDLNEPLKQFISTYSTTLFKKDQEKTKKLEQARQQLLAKGVSTRQITHIEKGAQHIIHGDLKRLLKKNFLNVAFSFENKMTGELLDNYNKYHAILDIAKQANLFNADPDGIKRLKEDAKQDSRTFLISELDRSMVETKLKTNSAQALMNVFDQFNKLAGFVKFSPSDYLKYFNKKIDNEGLLPFVSPDTIGLLDSDSQKKFGQHQSQEQEQNHEEKSEKDLLELYIKQQLPHKLWDTFKLFKDITKHEFGSNHSKEKLAQLKETAKRIALLRIRLEIRECFEHRATLPKLEGPEYAAIKKRLKTLLKSCKKLGHPILKPELKLIRDQCNQSLFSIIREEYIKTEVFLETQPKNATLLRQKDRFITILTRLKEETPIQESMKPKLMQDLHFLSDVNIVEAA